MIEGSLMHILLSLALCWEYVRGGYRSLQSVTLAHWLVKLLGVIWLSMNVCRFVCKGHF